MAAVTGNDTMPLAAVRGAAPRDARRRAPGPPAWASWRCTHTRGVNERDGDGDGDGGRRATRLQVTTHSCQTRCGAVRRPSLFQGTGCRAKHRRCGWRTLTKCFTVSPIRIFFKLGVTLNT